MPEVKEAKPLTPAQQRKRRQQQLAWTRAAIQAFFFLYMPGAFVAGFSGAKHLAQWIGVRETLQTDNFVLTLAALGTCTILFGRFFCGYVCAFGATGDFVYWLSGLVQKKLLKRKKQLRLPDKFILPAQRVKYVIMTVLLMLCVFGVYDDLTGVSPWDVFARLTALRAPMAGYAVGTVLLVLIVIGMAAHPRFFCQFLCPLGAIFALLPVLHPMQLHRNTENCIRGCQACRMNCPVSLKLDENDGREGECIACEKCTGVCPRGNISRPVFGKNQLAAVLAKAALFAVLGFALGLSRIG